MLATTGYIYGSEAVNSLRFYQFKKKIFLAAPFEENTHNSMIVLLFIKRNWREYGYFITAAMILSARISRRLTLKYDFWGFFLSGLFNFF